jgi:hypothetical protein
MIPAARGKGVKKPLVFKCARQPPLLPAIHCLFGTKLQIQRIIAMRPSNAVSGATFFSSARTASCRPADPAIAASCSTRSSPASTAAGAAQMQFLQQRAPEGLLPPPQASNARQCSRSAPPRLLGYAAAAVAAVIFACSVACSFAQHVAISGSSDIWRTSAQPLSQARYNLAATSLPNAGVAIFAGGLCTSFFSRLKCGRMGLGVRGMRGWVERGCFDVASLSCFVQRAVATRVLWTSSTW